MAKLLPHLQRADAGLENIRLNGVNHWPGAQKKRWSCPKCSPWHTGKDGRLHDIRHRSDYYKQKKTIKYPRAYLDSESEKHKIDAAPYKDKANVVLTLVKKCQYWLNVNNSWT